MKRSRCAWLCPAVLAAALLAACDRTGETLDAHDEGAHAEAPATNRIDVPPTVRQALGITFAPVERRPVERTLRLPGRFELRPEAVYECRAMLTGRVEVAVEHLQHVEAGELLLRIHSPQWQQMRHEIVEAQGAIKLAAAQLDVAKAAEEEARRALAFVERRLERLAETGVRRIELEAQREELANRLPRLEAEARSRQAELEEAREHFESKLQVAASVAGLSPRELAARAAGGASGGAGAWWEEVGAIEVWAPASGVVDAVEVADGAWVETGALLARIIDLAALRFRAEAPQSDLPRLREDLPVRIVLPESDWAAGEPIAGTLRLGVRGDADNRTLPVYAHAETLAPWAKPGVSGFLEIFTDGPQPAELAIPAASLVRDELRTIFYRRDPNNPDQVYPVEADLGPSDGRWVVVLSGVAEGDEVVHEGAYALRAAGGQRQAPPGYHYHADGSLHKDH